MATATERDQIAADQNKTLVTIVSVLLPPLGYVFVRRYALALLCFFTGAFFLLGFVVVPLHARKIISESRTVAGS